MMPQHQCYLIICMYIVQIVSIGPYFYGYSACYYYSQTILYCFHAQYKFINLIQNHQHNYLHLSSQTINQLSQIQCPNMSLILFIKSKVSLLYETALKYCYNFISNNYLVMLFIQLQKHIFLHRMMPQISTNAKNIKDLIDSTTPFTAEDRILCKNIWKQLHPKQRYYIVQSTLFSLTLDMIEKKKFEGEQIKLGKFLTLQLTLEEAINTHLTNYLSFISLLIRNRSMNLRYLLNEMTDSINKFTKELQKNNKQRIKDFRALENKDGSLSGQENDYYYPRKGSNYEEDQDLATQQENGRQDKIKTIRIQNNKVKTFDNLTINYSRTTKH